MSAPAPTLAEGAGHALSQMTEQMERARSLELKLRDAILALNARVAAGEKPDLTELFPVFESAFRAQRPDVQKVLTSVMGPLMGEIAGNDRRHEEIVGLLANLGIAIGRIAAAEGVNLDT